MVLYLSNGHAAKWWTCQDWKRLILLLIQNTRGVKNVVHKDRHSFSAKEESMNFSTVHAMIRDTEFFCSSRSVMRYNFTIWYPWDSQLASNKGTPHWPNKFKPQPSAIKVVLLHSAIIRDLWFWTSHHVRMQNITVKFFKSWVPWSNIQTNSWLPSSCCMILSIPMHCKVLKHPAFSPSLLLCNLHIFGLLRKPLMAVHSCWWQHAGGCSTVV